MRFMLLQNYTLGPYLNSVVVALEAQTGLNCSQTARRCLSLVASVAAGGRFAALTSTARCRWTIH
jgi:hypothetical protein